MENEHLIPAQVFCRHHSLEIDFITTLEDYGLLHLTRIEDEQFIEDAELAKVERLARLHNELEINPEGIDVINYLLDKMEEMQSEINQLKSKLGFYVSD